MDQREITAIVLIDLSKAFYSICHRTLLKLQGLSASSKATKWFESYLTNHMQSTRLRTSRSEELIVTHGVPQGSILGPLLLSLNMNDLPSVIKFSSVESYVDDTKVYLSFWLKDSDSCLIKVTEDLRLITAWCCTSILVKPNSVCLLRRLNCCGTLPSKQTVKSIKKTEQERCKSQHSLDRHISSERRWKSEVSDERIWLDISPQGKSLC